METIWIWLCNKGKSYKLTKIWLENKLWNFQVSTVIVFLPFVMTFYVFMFVIKVPYIIYLMKKEL